MNEHYKECPRDRMLTENAHQAHLLRTRQHQGLFSRARTYGEQPSIAGKYSLFSYDHIINIETFSRRWFIYLLLFAVCCSPSCLCQGLVSLILSVFYNWSPTTCLLYFRLAYFVLSVFDCFFSVFSIPALLLYPDTPTKMETTSHMAFCHKPVPLPERGKGLHSVLKLNAKKLSSEWDNGACAHGWVRWWENLTMTLFITL